jgi:hypothetical protein
MYDDLPEFQKKSRGWVNAFISRALTPRGKGTSALKSLQEFDDGHYRAVFSKDYFVIQEGNDAPSKSQWNTLKKHLKRMERQLFIFKDHGEVECDGETCYYIDFGFFAY